MRTLLAMGAVFVANLSGGIAIGGTSFDYPGVELSCYSTRFCDLRTGCVEENGAEIEVVIGPWVYVGPGGRDLDEWKRHVTSGLTVTGFPDLEETTGQGETVRRGLRPNAEPATFWRWATPAQRAEGVWFLTRLKDSELLSYVKRNERPEKPLGQRVERNVWYFDCELIREISFREFQEKRYERNKVD